MKRVIMAMITFCLVVLQGCVVKKQDILFQKIQRMFSDEEVRICMQVSYQDTIAVIVSSDQGYQGITFHQGENGELTVLEETQMLENDELQLLQYYDENRAIVVGFARNVENQTYELTFYPIDSADSQRIRYRSYDVGGFTLEVYLLPFDFDPEPEIVPCYENCII